MGNAESGPSFPERHAGVKKPMSWDGGDPKCSSDWEHENSEISDSNENFSPNSPRKNRRGLLPLGSKDPPGKEINTGVRYSQPDAPPSKTRRRREQTVTDRFHAVEQDDDDQIDYVDVTGISEEDLPALNKDFGEGVSNLVDASAAVFHYMGTGNSDEDISITDRSAAVFDMLQEEALKGNEKPMRKLLKTAQAVSHVLKKDVAPGRNDDEISISQQSAAVFQFLEKASSNEAMRVSDRNDGVFQWLNLNNDDDAQSVVSEMSAGIFKVLEDTKEKVDKHDVMEFSTAVFDMLEQGTAGDHDNENDTKSVSELSSAVFKVLDSTPSTDATPNHVEKAHTAPNHVEKPHSLEVSNFQPISSETVQGDSSYQSNLVERNIFHKLSRRTHTPDKPEEEDIFQKLRHMNVIPEEEEITDEALHLGHKLQALRSPQSTQLGHFAPLEQKEIQEHVFGEASEQEIQDEIDLVFVTKFDHAFNEFMGQNPKFLMSNPDLVQKIRVAKLHKILAHMEKCESNLSTQLSKLKEEKQTMEDKYHLNLRKASQKKASKQINLQTQLSAVRFNAQLEGAQLTWKIMDAAETRAKKLYQLSQNHKGKMAAMAKTSSDIPTRPELLASIPSDNEGQALTDAIAIDTNSPSERAVEELRNIQVENALMASKIVVVQKKLDFHKNESKKTAWVDAVLLRLDKAMMARLKRKFMASIGVKNL